MERLKFTPEQFFDGLLAAIRLQRQEGIIEGEPTEVHRAFYRVLKELRSSGILDVDLFEVDYDPLYGQSGWFASGVTSKPTIEGHFKTDQWNTTLDELVLPYRLARWQVQFEYQHSILQDLIPVFSFLDRELRFDN